MSKSLTRNERLSKRLFRAVFEGKKNVKGLFSKLVYLENNLSFSRFAVSLGKKYGNAVQRNYIKRLHKEIYRNNKEKIKDGYDVIIILYPGSATYQWYEDNFLALLEKAGLLV